VTASEVRVGFGASARQGAGRLRQVAWFLVLGAARARRNGVWWCVP